MYVYFTHRHRRFCIIFICKFWKIAEKNPTESGGGREGGGLSVGDEVIFINYLLLYIYHKG